VEKCSRLSVIRMWIDHRTLESLSYWLLFSARVSVMQADSFRRGYELITIH
jgi:hypothetical protein